MRDDGRVARDKGTGTPVEPFKFCAGRALMLLALVAAACWACASVVL